ncbi:hypothetical protein [Streptomyces sp. NBC_01455]|uniref:hypothetical protein n=1 Tax=Streptomyces sp. NBC_01455 TaxID=2903874 RepID=UPI002E31F280|nr:hypothetical protein [Streptomyces sp. NBC_01455]
MRIGRIDSAAVVGELRQLHEDAEDRNIDQMPADEELYGALLYLETNFMALKGDEARRTAALSRVKLWEYIRERADIHQQRAIEDARSAAIEWSGLTHVLAVNTPSAAYNKALRMRASAMADASQGELAVRRTPEAVLEAEQRAAALAAAERRVAAEASRRHILLAPVAHRLIQHRDGLDDGDEISYWLDEIEAVLPNCHTATQLISLETYVRAAVRELRKTERRTARQAGTTGEAQRAYAAAVALVAED